MIISFSECSNTLESLYFIALCIFVTTSIIGGFGVYTNEKKMTEKKAYLNEIFSGVSVFFTGEFLNETGKKWRPIYVYSIVFLIILILIGVYFQPCT